MCTTAFHTVADQVEAAVGIPFLHLADVVADAMHRPRPRHGRAARHVVHDAAAVLRRPARLARPRGRRPDRASGTRRSTRSSTASWCTGKVLDASRDDRRRRHRRAVGRRRPGRDPRLHRARAAGQAGRLRDPGASRSTTLHVEAALDRALAEVLDLALSAVVARRCRQHRAGPPADARGPRRSSYGVRLVVHDHQPGAVAHRDDRQVGGRVDRQRGPHREHQVGLGGQGQGGLDDVAGTAPARRTPSRTSPARRTCGQSGSGSPASTQVERPARAARVKPQPSGAPCRGVVPDAHHLAGGAVHLDDPRRAGVLVQAVDVLGDDAGRAAGRSRRARAGGRRWAGGPRRGTRAASARTARGPPADAT